MTAVLAGPVFGQNVHLSRKAMGRRLAQEAPVEADRVVPVPNCARCAAIGYSQESGIALGRAFTTSHYAGRSFILPEQSQRDLAVKMKLNVIRDAVKGKRLVVVEDSVVRGTTTRGKMGALRRAGAKEIHLRVASPPILGPCFYGIDMSTVSELFAPAFVPRAYRGEVPKEFTDRMAQAVHADSLKYLPIKVLAECIDLPEDQLCLACLNHRYPTPTGRRLYHKALRRSRNNDHRRTYE